MRRGLLAGLRALLVAICTLLLATVAGYHIKSAANVALFFLFIAGLWILIERALMTAVQSKKSKPESN
jgi:hypothetical protein